MVVRAAPDGCRDQRYQYDALRQPEFRFHP
jgi:hypothetical protein